MSGLHRLQSSASQPRDPAEIAKALARRAEDVAIALLGEPTSKSRREFPMAARRVLNDSRPRGCA
jgi:hypothetical protein